MRVVLSCSTLGCSQDSHSPSSDVPSLQPLEASSVSLSVSASSSVVYTSVDEESPSVVLSLCLRPSIEPCPPKTRVCLSSLGGSCSMSDTYVKKEISLLPFPIAQCVRYNVTACGLGWVKQKGLVPVAAQRCSLWWRHS